MVDVVMAEAKADLEAQRAAAGSENLASLVDAKAAREADAARVPPEKA